MTLNNIVFAGTPDFAASSLKALLDNGFPVQAVFTQPDRRSGRGQNLTLSPVKELALNSGLQVFQPGELKSDNNARSLQELKPDLLIVVAYGLLLPRTILDIPTHGCINVHASLLPRWRGAAPIQRAIMAGDKETGTTIMKMDEGLDTGDMLLQKSCEISPQDTGSSLHDKLAVLGAECLIDCLNNFAEYSLSAVKQNENDANYAKKLNKEDARINWLESAESIHNHVRGLNSWPVAQSDLGGKTVRIWQTELISNESGKPPGTIVDIGDKSSPVIQVQTGNGCINILIAQIPGKKPVSAKELLNGFSNLFSIDHSFE